MIYLINPCIDLLSIYLHSRFQMDLQSRFDVKLFLTRKLKRLSSGHRNHMLKFPSSTFRRPGLVQSSLVVSCKFPNGSFPSSLVQSSVICDLIQYLLLRKPNLSRLGGLMFVLNLSDQFKRSWTKESNSSGVKF